jgi:hypothetical protein
MRSQFSHGSYVGGRFDQYVFNICDHAQSIVLKVAFFGFNI